MQAIVTNVRGVMSVSLSVTRLNSASLCKNVCTDQDTVWDEQSRGPTRHCVTRWSRSPTDRGGGPTFKFWGPLVFPRLEISGACRQHKALMKTIQKYVIGVGAGSRDRLLKEILRLPTYLRITATESCACSVCGAFDAAFAKCLWPLVS